MDGRDQVLMRILMVTQWFDPEPTFKGLAFAKALREKGHEVEVLTGFPNYPEGRIYPGYRQRFLHWSVVEGISVLRVPLYPSHDHSPVRRTANYLSFALSASTIGPMLVKPADVMYVLHAPATIGLPAVVLKWLRRIPFVYDVNDLWPDTLGATGMLNSKASLWLVDKWCRFVYRCACRIVVVTPGFKEALVARGVPERKIDMIYNWCEEDKIRKGPRNEALAKELGLAGRFNVIYSGTMGLAQGLESVLHAAGRLCARIPVVQFVFIGGGVEVDRLKRIAREKHLGNVLFLPRRPVSEIGEILNLADALLVHLKDNPLFRITIPSKIQAYLAIGRPILAGVQGDAADLVRKAGAGVVCHPENPERLSEAVEKLYRMPRSELEEMGNNGKIYYEKELSMSSGVNRFEKIFQAATEKLEIIQ